MLDLILSSQDTSGLNIVKLFPSSPTYWYYLKAQWTMNRQRGLQKVARHGTFGQFYPCGEWGWGVETIQTSKYGGSRSSNLFRQWIQNACIGQLINAVLQSMFLKFHGHLCAISQRESNYWTLFTGHTTMEWTIKVVMCFQGKIWQLQRWYYWRTGSLLFRSECLVSRIFLYYV